MKFRPNRFNSVPLTERTQNCIYLCYKGNNLKNEHARVMVLCMTSRPNVLYKRMQFRFNTSNSYRADMKLHCE